MGKQIRPEPHKTDTLARRKVPMAFPAEWEHRELTGTDYGIDMVVEIFKDGVATGGQLSLQIKGTRNVIQSVDRVTFDMPVNTLKYSELFIVPVILVLCPVENEQSSFYFLWLQEYIKVILDHEKPKWRQNKATVRVSIPTSNCMPGNEKKLEFISRFPRRIFDWCQYARICEDIKYSLDSFLGWDDLIKNADLFHSDMTEEKNYKKEDLDKLIQLITEMTELKGIFEDQEWSYPQYMLNDIIMPALNSAKELYDDTCEDAFEAKSTLVRINSATALLGIYNDYNFSRILWEEDGNHMF